MELEFIKEYKFKDEATGEWFYRTKYKVLNPSEKTEQSEVNNT